MDKFKKYLAVAQKYHFWIICGVVLLTAIVCWWIATAALDSERRQRETKLNGDFKNVIIAQNHPNQRVLDQIQKDHEELKAGVFSAWQELYEEQRSKNPFPDVVDGGFRQQFENLKPKMELKAEYRERYQNFIKNHLPKLLKIIDVRRPPEDKDKDKEGVAARPVGADPIGGGRDGRAMRGGAGGPGGNATTEEWIGTVEWNDSDYRLLEQRFEWNTRPSTLAVVLAQEDLWVIEALLRIIKDTNAGATNYNTAIVKRIEALQIGREAVAAWKDGEDSVIRTAGGGAGGGGMMTMGGRGPMDMTGPGTAGGSGDEQARRTLVENRYVDDKGKPLPYDVEYPYAKHPYAEFKMMPIRMDLVMDQRHLPKLLVECANSNMPVMVRRVRIKTQPGNVFDLGGGQAAAGGGGGGRGGGGMGPARGPAMAQPRATAAPAARQTTDKKEESGPYDIPVEIQGVIYIYNPPDIDRLGTGAAATEKAAEKAGEKPAEKPADKPAEKPLEKAADKPAEKPVDKAAEKPVGKAAGKPADKADDAADAEEEKPAKKPAAPAKEPADAEPPTP